jgi:A118 family predicted phage portal protein
MFNTMQSMGLYGHTDKGTELTNINEITNKRIWLGLYKGYCSSIHDSSYWTIANPNFGYRIASLGMPKKVCEYLAQLIFNDKIEINISDNKLNEFVNQVLNNNNYITNAQEYTEKMFALGGKLEIVYFDGINIKIDYYTVDQFEILENTKTMITSIVTYNYTKNDDDETIVLETTYIFDEIESTNSIENKLFKYNSKDKPKTEILLSEFYPELQISLKINNMKQPIFVYTKPRLANNINFESPEGISIYANSIDILREIDLTYDGMKPERESAERKLHLAESVIFSHNDSKTGIPIRYYDSRKRIYQGTGGEKTTATEFDLRLDKFIEAITFNLSMLSMNIGLSSGTFVFNGVSVKTATEIISEKSDTFRTKINHESAIKIGLEQLIRSIIDLGDSFELVTKVNEYKINIKFDDSIIIDDEKIRENERLDIDLGTLPKKEYIMINYNKSEQEADEWLAQIESENALVFDSEPVIEEEVIENVETS